MAPDDEPQWLDEAEMAAWLPLMGLLVMVPAQLDAHMQRTSELNQFEYLILARLSEAEGHTMRISELATQWFGSLSRLSHLIKRLEQRGWVRREPDPLDGRYTNAVLTEAGWDKIVATAPEQVAVVRRLVLDHLTRAQLRQVQTVATRVLDALADDPSLRHHRTGQGRGRPPGGCTEAPSDDPACESFPD